MNDETPASPQVFPRSTGRLIDGRRDETVKVRLDIGERSEIARAAKAANCTPARFLRDAGLSRAREAERPLDTDLGQVILVFNALFLQAHRDELRICPKLGEMLAAELRRAVKKLDGWRF